MLLICQLEHNEAGNSSFVDLVDRAQVFYHSGAKNFVGYRVLTLMLMVFRYRDLNDV